jgi:membrane-associated protease RseP (regulator of RpoE activity)
MYMAIGEPSATSFIDEDLAPALSGLIEPRDVARPRSGAIVVRGRLLQPAESAYRTLRARFERLGYTPFLQPHADGVELIAAPGVIQRRPQRWVLNVVLFALTVLSVLFTGAFNQYPFAANVAGIGEALRVFTNAILATPTVLLAGVPFAATLLGILFAHEMGHYVVSRLRGAPASLPYFIPMPPIISLTGTMGAVIVQREPFEDRRTLLEVAIAGPLAGLVLAIPLLFYGLSISTIGAIPPNAVLEGNSIFYALAKFAVFGQWLPGNGVDVQLSSVAWGAWIGLLITAINLLPVGQLDGGHVAYALLGRRADYLAYATMLVLLASGIFLGGGTWLVFVILLVLMGPRHPAPFNDVTRLKPIHVALGIVGLITFVLLFTPQPLV